MTSRHSNFKLGVLNMTICFDQPHTTRSRQRYENSPISKIDNLPSFVPNYCRRSGNAIHSQRKEGPMSPYQNYRKSHRASLKYYREHHEQSRIAGLRASISGQQSATIDTHFNRNFTEEESQNAYVKPVKGTGLKFTINKRHLKHFPAQNSQNLIHQNFVFKVEDNPQDALKQAFSVRPVKTSFRSKRQSREKSGRISFRPPATKQQPRRKCNKAAEIDKNIRPWSPTRHNMNRQLILQPEMMLSGYPHYPHQQ